jgi:uroporphyrin-III C-methyltransferase/precorrin-2 dehydrogenase/sirohydrochlorin ferrochelatase
MNHFPIFLALSGRDVVLSGGGETALAKLRLLLKTTASITVYAAAPSAAVVALADAGRIGLVRRALAPGDIGAARLFYAAEDDEKADARSAAIARREGALVNIVDNLAASDFLTPAIVDRDPVTVAIGTEGAAPVLARSIKADLEARLPAQLGRLARIAASFRGSARALAPGRARRRFWAEVFERTGPAALEQGGAEAAEEAIGALLDRRTHETAADLAGHVDLVGAGPGDPELLTLKARRALDGADVVIHDRLVPQEILELARREAVILPVGKQGFGASARQEDINDLIVSHARSGAHVVRLKGGDPTIFGRLDEEISACEAAGVSWSVIPGITAASAAVASIGQSLTQRGRNGSLRLLTGHDIRGFAEHDWRALALPGAVAAIYMGKRSARFIQGRLMMHGAAAQTPVSVVENASLPTQKVRAATIAGLARAVEDTPEGTPAIILLGLAPRAAAKALADQIERLG